MKLPAILLTSLMSVLLAGCSSISHKPQSGAPPDIKTTRYIAIFLDGTNNNEESDTNVKKLHSLVTLQDRPDIASLYIQGVGTGADITGAATGSGTNKRAQLAYEFILNHYRFDEFGAPSKIYIFGFSRGAYTARILTSMLYHAGLPAPIERPDCGLTTAELAEAVHEAVAPQSAHVDPIDETKRRGIARKKLQDFNLSNGESRLLTKGCFPAPTRDVDIEVLGLWDTVEALGFANWSSRIADKLNIDQHHENIDVRNFRYGDKLCNVHHAFHATSIDDNRAWIFTPLLLTRRHLFEGCETGEAAPKNPMLKDGEVIQNRLQEVWFAGAHSDVGGGYDGSALSGVSLNWMIKLLKNVSDETKLSNASDVNRHGLLPPNARVQEDIFGSSHNPSTGLFNLTYHLIHRDLAYYMDGEKDKGLSMPTSLNEDVKAHLDSEKNSGALPGQSTMKSEPLKRPNPVNVFKDKLCAHSSVFERRNRIPPQHFENTQLILKKPGIALLTQKIIDPPLRWTRYVEESETNGRLPQVKLEVQEYPNCININMPAEKF